MNLKLSLPVSVLAVLVASSSFAEPPTRKQKVVDTYHGVAVSDEFRWLEDSSSTEVQTWSDDQNNYTRSVFDQLPRVKEIRAQVKSILEAPSSLFYNIQEAGGKYFALHREPPKQQPFLVLLGSLNDPKTATVLADPNTMTKSAIDWFVPSPDGKLVAVSISKRGTESGDVTVIDTATGKTVFETVPRVNGGTAGGDLAWASDSSGFFYSRYPRGNERPAVDMDFYTQVYYHALGTPTENDRYEIGKDLPRIAELKLERDPKSNRILLTVQDGDGGEFALFLRSENGDWKKFADFKERIVQAAFGPKEDLYLISRDGAPRGKLLRLEIANLDLSKATVAIAEGPDTIVSDFSHRYGRQTVIPTDNRIYVLYQMGGPSEVRVFDYTGKQLTAPAQPSIGAVGELARLEGDNISLLTSSFVEPPNQYFFDAKLEKTEKLNLASVPPVDFKDVTVRREFAPSKDGTLVPVNIVIPKSAKLDGTDPCLVTGYGGYGVSVPPSFVAANRVLVDNGVIFVLANIRGGGEYGDAWHLNGNLAKKQNVFDDFTGALEYLIAKKYTSPQRLAIRGGSNGGLLMGAVLTQHPDLMKAVVAQVGIYDMLRIELDPNGQFNIPEFGTVKDETLFRAMHAYSPFHNVRDGVAYPATLFMTGKNDPRVNPAQSRKMVARMQEASSCPDLVFLRTSDAGHGAGTALSDRIEEYVDIFAFLFKELGITAPAVKP